MQADATRPGSNIEHTPSCVTHRSPLVGRPPAERRQVQLRPDRARADETVIALNHLDDILTLKCRDKQLPVGVASRLDDHLPSIARELRTCAGAHSGVIATL
jgi:hypothetical protein